MFMFAPDPSSIFTVLALGKEQGCVVGLVLGAGEPDKQLKSNDRVVFLQVSPITFEEVT
jgi:hypothetical protein